MRTDREKAAERNLLWLLGSLAVGIGLSLLLRMTGATPVIAGWAESAVSHVTSSIAWLWDSAGGFLVFLALAQVGIFGGRAIARAVAQKRRRLL